MNQKEILIITITIFLTTMGWIIADLVHVSSTQKVEEINPRFSQPINIKLNKSVFTILEQKN